MDQAAVMVSISDKAQSFGLARLNPAERIIYLASWVSFEVQLGGFSSYFYTSAGDHAPEAVAALEAIGAVHAAAAVRSAIACLPGDAYPANTERRCEALPAIEDSLSRIEGEFSRDEPDIDSRLWSFIDAYAAELAEHVEAT